MSEVRRVGVRLKDVDNVLVACEAAGLKTQKKKVDGIDRICILNHGMSTYREVYFNELEDGTLELSGQASQGELRKLTQKIKLHYAKKVAIDLIVSKGYSVVSDERDVVRKKIMVKVRKFA